MTTGFAYLLPLLLAPSISPPGLCGFWELWGLQMAPGTPWWWGAPFLGPEVSPKLHRSSQDSGTVERHLYMSQSLVKYSISARCTAELKLNWQGIGSQKLLSRLPEQTCLPISRSSTVQPWCVPRLRETR